MKKRMLITTIVMVLVVAIALTTSSLAWFTMSASVSISEVSFGAVAYSGVDLSVAGLSRTGFSTNASIGNGVTFKPVQGDPTAVNAMTLPDTASVSGYTTEIGEKYPVSFVEGTWFEAQDVTTTPVGNNTANQKVKLKAAVRAAGEEIYFVGGFNVRNSGAAEATLKITAQLNVGTPHLISGQNELPEYAYGDPVRNEDDEIVGYAPNDKDNALAGALRVAVYTRTWTYDSEAEEYENAAAAHLEGIWGFSNYKVVWNSGLGKWSVTNATGETNNVYVTSPEADKVYSKNPNLGTVVGSGETGCEIYDVYALGAGNVLPALNSYKLPALAGGVYSGIELVIIAWLDGWDDEALPIAGGGSVSLSYNVAG